MSETKSTKEFKDIKTNLIVLTAGTNLLEAFPIEDVDSVDVTITLVKKKADIQQ
jgi:hypothetical protein